MRKSEDNQNLSQLEATSSYSLTAPSNSSVSGSCGIGSLPGGEKMGSGDAHPPPLNPKAVLYYIVKHGQSNM